MTRHTFYCGTCGGSFEGTEHDLFHHKMKFHPTPPQVPEFKKIATSWLLVFPTGRQIALTNQEWDMLVQAAITKGIE